MEEIELGQATIVYEDPEDGVVSETVDNEALVYVRDHWMVRTGTDDDGNDLMKQIPRDRVHHVDRTVEQFEEQAGTMRKRVESIASDLRERLPVDVGGEGRRKRQPEDAPADEPHEIPVEDSDETAGSQPK